MTQVQLDIPDEVLLAEKADAETFSHEIRLLAAVKLFELGRLTSGRAALMAGLSRVGLLMRLEHYQVFPLSAELEEMEQASAGRDH